MKAKVLFAVMLVVAIALIATACAPAPAPAAPTAAAAKFTCTDKLGCVDIGPTDPVHIAYAMVTSGANSTLGLDTKYGAEIAVDDAAGKVLGHAIKFDGQDSGCSAEGGQAAATKIAADKTVVAVIGTNCSSENVPAAPIITNAGLTMISPSATASYLTDPGKRQAGFFRTAHNDVVQAAAAATFVYTQLKLTKAAAVHDGGPYTQGLAQGFADFFKKAGGTVTTVEAVNVGDTDMKPVLTRIAAGKPDLIYFPIFVPEGGALAAQIRDVPGLEKTVLMAADGVSSPDFLKAGGKNVVGLYLTGPDKSAFKNYQALVDKYLKKYNVKGVLAPFQAHSYDAMNIILAALQAPGVVAKDADGSLHVNKGALRDAIAATKNFAGITGNLTCNANGDCADPHIAVYQITADNFANLLVPTTPVWNFTQ